MKKPYEHHAAPTSDAIVLRDDQDALVTQQLNFSSVEPRGLGRLMGRRLQSSANRLRFRIEGRTMKQASANGIDIWDGVLQDLETDANRER